MLNKQREAPRAVRVPLDEYTAPTTRYVRRPDRDDDAAADPSAAFVLFHRGLVEACKERGVLGRSDAASMWAVVARHSKPWPEDPDDADGEKTHDPR